MASEIRKVTSDPGTKQECVIVPAVDIFETGDEFLLKVEMPGVEKDGLVITLNNNELEINGKVDANLLNEENAGYTEFRLNDYHRRFIVGDNINSSGITANLDNGVLTLKLPKSERIKPKRIEVAVEK